jgi:hypothetical protein
MILGEMTLGIITLESATLIRDYTQHAAQTTLSKSTLSIMTLNITTFSVITLIMTTFSVTTLNTTTFCITTLSSITRNSTHCRIPLWRL